MRRFKTFLEESSSKSKSKDKELKPVWQQPFDASRFKVQVGETKPEKEKFKVHHYKPPPPDIPAIRKHSSEYGGMSFYGPGEK